VEPEALQLALRFQNACNPFLKEASNTFLNILRKEIDEIIYAEYGISKRESCVIEKTIMEE